MLSNFSILLHNINFLELIELDLKKIFIRKVIFTCTCLVFVVK